MDEDARLTLVIIVCAGLLMIAIVAIAAAASIASDSNAAKLCREYGYGRYCNQGDIEKK